MFQLKILELHKNLVWKGTSSWKETSWRGHSSTPSSKEGFRLDYPVCCQGEPQVTREIPPLFWATY